MPQPRMSSFTESFSNISSIIKQTEYLGNASDTDWVYTGYVNSYDDALLLQMPNGSTGSVVSLTKYLWFGKVGATIKSSRDRGVIAAFITFSDVQDEIDYEFLGYNLTFPQTNYYSKGILNYSNTGDFEVTDTFENWHYYEMDWQEDKVIWSVDGKEVRTLERALTWNATTNRYDFPSTPSRVQFSLWPGGSSLNGLGTIEWAGGAINWDSTDIKEYGYYYASVKNFSVVTYDLPSYLGNKNYTNYHAFLYNSTDGNEDNIYLTNEKTWLGSSDASGLNPDNENEDQTETSSVVVLSGSSTYTSASVRTKATSAQDPAKNTKAAGTSSTSEYTGGFVQNSKATSSSPASSGSTSTSGARSTNNYGILSAMVAACAAAGSVFFVGF